jgi:hypothetical protein
MFSAFDTILSNKLFLVEGPASGDIVLSVDTVEEESETAGDTGYSTGDDRLGFSGVTVSTGCATEAVTGSILNPKAFAMNGGKNELMAVFWVGCK